MDIREKIYGRRYLSNAARTEWVSSGNHKKVQLYYPQESVDPQVVSIAVEQMFYLSQLGQNCLKDTRTFIYWGKFGVNK